MRRQDKVKNIERVNVLFEQRCINESKYDKMVERDKLSRAFNKLNKQYLSIDAKMNNEKNEFKQEEYSEQLENIQSKMSVISNKLEYYDD
jgi:hypothetical protein